MCVKIDKCRLVGPDLCLALFVIIFFCLIFKFSVAIGAAIQAAVLKKDRTAPRILLKNVTPLSVGILIPPVPGTFSCYIKRNSPYPIEVTRLGRTHIDFQENMVIPIFEGETSDSSNRIGKLVLKVTPRKKNLTKALLTVKIDRNGEITAKAVERGTDNTVSTTIKRKQKHTHEEIDALKTEMVKIFKWRIQCPESIQLKKIKIPPSSSKRLKVAAKIDSDEVCPIYGRCEHTICSGELDLGDI